MRGSGLDQPSSLMDGDTLEHIAGTNGSSLDQLLLMHGAILVHVWMDVSSLALAIVTGGAGHDRIGQTLTTGNLMIHLFHESGDGLFVDRVVASRLGLDGLVQVRLLLAFSPGDILVGDDGVPPDPSGIER